MDQDGPSDSDDDSECVQRKRLKRIEGDLLLLEQRMESIEKAVAKMKER
jgi:hypothetical protein